MYEFTCGAKVAVFTWHGCRVELIGKTDVNYIAKETPMNRYLNCHADIEQIREIAEKDGTRGPVVMVVGPADVGKSTLCKLLLNYAVKMGRRPIYVDLDVAQSHIAIPGTVGALLVEGPSDVVDGFEQQAPLVFHFGSTNPNSNSVLYNLLVSRLASVCSNRLQANKKSKVSGIIINTCGLMKDGGYKMLAHAAQAFEVDVILVLDQERLYIELVRDMPDSVRVICLPKSGGVVERTQTQKNEARDQSVREYFYGSSIRLYPYSLQVKWSEAKLFKIGVPMLPSSCMPLGMKAEDNLTKLVAVTPGPSLLYHLLSVSFANSPQDVIQRNVAGFICV